MKKALLSIVLVFSIIITAMASGHVATAVGVNVSCNGMCNGSATASASGGIGPYGFAWTGPASYTAAGASITGLCAGSYTVTAIDSSDMSTAAYILSITEPVVLSVTVNSPTICAGGAATLTATVSGGTPGYIYSWVPSSGLSCSTCSSPTANPVVTSSYTITSTDASGCTGTAFATITVNPGPVVTVNSPTICAGQTAFLTATGGTTYSWSPGATPTGAGTADAAPPTTTTYTVTGAMTGCTGTALSTVTVVASPVITLFPSSAVCGACNGAITANAPGAISYSWTGPAGFTSTATSITGLCPGTYTLTATNGMGCTSVANATVLNTLPPVASVSSVTNSTCGACDGMAIGTASGGTPPYTFLWVPGGGTTATAVGLCAGTYTVNVTDANGCNDAVIAVINSSTGPSSAAITTVASNCIASTGEINIGTITGGLAPYQYSVNGGPLSSTTNYTGLAPGNYAVVIEDANGCVLNEAATILFTNPPVITLDSMNGISCAAGTSGNIFLSITAGTPAYSILWSNGAVTEDLTNINTYGYYTITVSDAAGCSVNSTYYISSAISVYGTASSTALNCGVMGTASVIPYGGTTPYTYAWNTIPVQTAPTATGLAAGTHTCVITDAAGCSGNVIMNVPNLGCSNVIKGRLYNDLNSNCIQDAGENGLVGKTIIVTPGYYYATTDANGNYTVSTPNMTNTVSVSLYTIPYYSPICPATGSMNVNFSLPGDTSTNNNFGYYSNPSFFNLGIHPGWTSGNPGFPKHYWVYPINSSPTAQNAVISFVYDSNLVYTSSTLGGTHFPAQRKIEWIFNLPPSGGGLISAFKPDIVFTVPATMSITSTLTSYFEISPIVGDSYPTDNTLLVTEPVTGCRDPNAKSVIPEGQGPNGNIFQGDSVLFYAIHFQNNGNDTAHFVVVTDTLSTFLDPATVVPGASSHPYAFDLSGTGILNFRFENIMLPDSTTDEPGSNGYFNYTVKIKTGSPIGTVINNTAHIYFDYNEAVVTNTTVNTIIDVLTDIESSSTNRVIKVYPNPFSDNTTFIIQSDKINERYSFELLDVLGKKVKTISGITEKQFDLTREELQNGIYFYRIFSAERIVGVGKVIIK